MNKLHFISSCLLSLLLLTIANRAEAQTEYHWFRHEGVAQPYTAEMYSTLPKIELVKMNKFHPFYLKGNPADRVLVEAQAGFQLSFLTIERELSHGRLKATLSSTTNVTTLIDVLEKTTAPVVNNDYRIGAKLFFHYTPTNSSNSFFKNYHLTLVPILHESTHIGDEFTIDSYTKLDDFARINIGYEVWQLNVGFNKDYDRRKPNLSAEIGYQRLLPNKPGFYKIDKNEVKGQEIPLSKNKDSWFLRAEYTYPILYKGITGNNLVASAEIQRGTKFGYTADNPEKRAWSANLYAGYRIPIKNTQRHVGIYLRHYRGIIPYGQLRDMDGFYMTGLSVVVN